MGRFFSDAVETALRDLYYQMWTGRGREAFRLLAPWVRPGFDLVLVARGKTPFVKSTDVGRHLQRQLKAAGLLREDMP